MKAKNKGGRPMKYGVETEVISFRVPKNKKLISEIKEHLKNKLSNYLK